MAQLEVLVLIGHRDGCVLAGLCISMCFMALAMDRMPAVSWRSLKFSSCSGTEACVCISRYVY